METTTLDYNESYSSQPPPTTGLTPFAGVSGAEDDPLHFTSLGLATVIVYSVLFVFSAVGNLTVFITLFMNRQRKSRVNLFIMHLSLADLVVTFIFIPLEIAWHLTVAWIAGDAACRFMMFFRAFGFYLSSFILVVISLDRYFAILHPLSLSEADKRGRIMLVLAWLLSAVAAVPQSVIFHVEKNPDVPSFEQCVTFNFFPSPAHRLVYNMFTLVITYAVPLLVIVVSYALILCEMTRKAREYTAGAQVPSDKVDRNILRRSNVGHMERARSKTLLLTLMMVAVFFVCWTPYFVMSLWYWFDSDSAAKLDERLQKGLFIFAVSNSCMNPLVYGIFSLNLKREFDRCCCVKKSRRQNTYFEMLSHSAQLHNHSTSLHSNGRPLIYTPTKTFSKIPAKTPAMNSSMTTCMTPTMKPAMTPGMTDVNDTTGGGGHVPLVYVCAPSPTSVPVVHNVADVTDGE